MFTLLVLLKAGTKVSPSTIIPSLQVLALKLYLQDKEQPSRPNYFLASSDAFLTFLHYTLR